PEFFRQGEEGERSMRIYDRGYRIVALPSVSVFHAVSPLNRDKTKINQLLIRNAILRELINAPLLLLPFALFRVLLSGVRLLGLKSCLSSVVEVFSLRELRQMILRRRRAMGFVRYIVWKMMIISQ